MENTKLDGRQARSVQPCPVWPPSARLRSGGDRGACLAGLRRWPGQDVHLQPRALWAQRCTLSSEARAATPPAGATCSLPVWGGGRAFLLERAGAGERGCVQFAGHWGWTLPHLCVQVEARAWGEPALFEKG